SVLGLQRMAARLPEDGYVSRGQTDGTDSQFPANCAGNLVSVPGLQRIAARLPEGGYVSVGNPWDRQPISGKVRRKFGVSPGIAAYCGPPLPKRLRFPWANPGTDSQFPAKCAGDLVSVPGLQRIAARLPQNGYVSRGQTLGQTANFRQSAPEIWCQSRDCSVLR